MAASKSMCEVSAEEILQTIGRYVNCLTDDNRNSRKRAIEGIKKETTAKKPNTVVLQCVLREIMKPLLKLVSDPVEKCRELTIMYLKDCVDCIPKPQDVLPFIMPVLVQRLGQQEITEPSEELRFQLVELLTHLVDLSGQIMHVYLDDSVAILQRTIVDPYPEVKKQSCQCSQLLAKNTAGYFHMQSESLVKPLLLTLSHQHSRVRLEVVKAIGDVLQYGNGKNVEDVVSHLAQRLFDQTPQVRMAVTQVVGGWLLDLPDRYSFHHKLIPLLLTSITDEVPEIKLIAESLWHDVGLKYEGENEDDFKDKQDFMKPDPNHYPSGVERPNIGCRQLVYRNMSKILGGLLKDITDWVVATRIKSAQLLYTLLLNSEENITQHMEKLISGLQRAALDDEPEVITYVVKSAELIGYFVDIEMWCKMALQSVKVSQNHGSVMVLAAIIRGSQKSQLKTHLHDICSVLGDPEICRTATAPFQQELVSCVEGLVNVSQEDCACVSTSLFTVLVTVLALLRQESLANKVEEILSKLATVQGLESKLQLYERHTREVIAALKDEYTMWTQHSVERLIFDTLLVESGPVVGEMLEDIIPVLVANLSPDKDPEVRLKFFSLLSRLVMNAPVTLDSKNRFGEFTVTVVRKMILPNCVWIAGRTAGAIRTTAISCLWAMLKSGMLTKDKLLEITEEVLTQLLSLLDDENKSTRLICCRVTTLVFSLAGPALDLDRLHNMYPDLLKRLDDSSEDIRVAICKTWEAYFSCFQDYKVSLYKAHLEHIYKGLLVHLDDSDPAIQDAVLDVLKSCAKLHPDMLMKEVDNVIFKHRDKKYCEKLLAHINSLPRDQ